MKIHSQSYHVLLSECLQYFWECKSTIFLNELQGKNLALDTFERNLLE